VSYFVVAWVVGHEELLFRRLKTFGVLVALAFFVYYASAFGEWGIHKEDTSLPVQFGMVATLLFVKAAVEKHPSWIAPSAVIFTASFLLFMRHILLTFFFASALALGILTVSRLRKVFFYGVAALILLPSVFPFGAQYVLDVLEKDFHTVYELMPEGTHDTRTLMDRNVELFTSGVLLLQHPAFGTGMGSDFGWTRPDVDDPEYAYVQKHFVDNGWAYIAVKMGGFGILAFGWVLIGILRCLSRESLTISISLLAILLITMWSEPVCFQFTMSPIAGALAGLLYAKKHPPPLSPPVALLG
jgi:hypothetical protein